MYLRAKESQKITRSLIPRSQKSFIHNYILDLFKKRFSNIDGYIVGDPQNIKIYENEKQILRSLQSKLITLNSKYFLSEYKDVMINCVKESIQE